MTGNLTSWNQESEPSGLLENAFSDVIADVEATWSDPSRFFFLTLPIRTISLAFIVCFLIADVLQVVAMSSFAMEILAKGLNRASKALLNKTEAIVRLLHGLLRALAYITLVIVLSPTILKQILKLGGYINALVQEASPYFLNGLALASDSFQTFLEISQDAFVQAIEKSTPIIQEAYASLVSGIIMLAEMTSSHVASLASSLADIRLDWLPSVALTMNIPKNEYEDDIANGLKYFLGTVLFAISVRKIVFRFRNNQLITSEEIHANTSANVDCAFIEEEEEEANEEEEPEQTDAASEADVASQESMPELESEPSICTPKNNDIDEAHMNEVEEREEGNETDTVSPYFQDEPSIRISNHDVDDTMSPIKYGGDEVSTIQTHVGRRINFHDSHVHIAPLNESESDVVEAERTEVIKEKEYNVVSNHVSEPDVIDLSLDDEEDDNGNTPRHEISIHSDVENNRVTSQYNSPVKVTKSMLKKGPLVTVVGTSRPGVGHIHSVFANDVVDVKRINEKDIAYSVPLANLRLGAHPELVASASKRKMLLGSSLKPETTVRKLRSGRTYGF